jgi:hypothetical protein
VRRLPWSKSEVPCAHARRAVQNARCSNATGTTVSTCGNGKCRTARSIDDRVRPLLTYRGCRRVPPRHRRKSPPKVTPPSVETRGAEECGPSAASGTLCTWSKLPILLEKKPVSALHRRGGLSAPSGVDFSALGRLYDARIRHAAAFGATARLRSSSSIFGDPAPIPIGSHKLRRLCV